jgi:hypothetical protein
MAVASKKAKGAAGTAATAKRRTTASRAKPAAKKSVAAKKPAAKKAAAKKTAGKKGAATKKPAAATKTATKTAVAKTRKPSAKTAAAKKPRQPRGRFVDVRKGSAGKKKPAAKPSAAKKRRAYTSPWEWVFPGEESDDSAWGSDFPEDESEDEETPASEQAKKTPSGGGNKNAADDKNVGPPGYPLHIRKQLHERWRAQRAAATAELGEGAGYMRFNGDPYLPDPDRGDDEEDAPKSTDVEALYAKFYDGFFFKPAFMNMVRVLLKTLPTHDGYGRTGQTSHGDAVLERYMKELTKLKKDAPTVFKGNDVKKRLKHFARVLALLIFMFDGPFSAFWLFDNESEPGQPAQIASDLLKLATEHFDKATDPKTQLGVAPLSVGPLRRFYEHEVKCVVRGL